MSNRIPVPDTIFSFMAFILLQEISFFWTWDYQLLCISYRMASVFSVEKGILWLMNHGSSKIDDKI